MDREIEGGSQMDRLKHDRYVGKASRSKNVHVLMQEKMSVVSNSVSLAVFLSYYQTRSHD